MAGRSGFPETGGDDQSCFHGTIRALSNEARYRGGGRDDYGKVDGLRKAAYIGIGSAAEHELPLRIDGVGRNIRGVQQICENRSASFSKALGRTHNSNASGKKECVERASSRCSFRRGGCVGI